MNLPVSTSPPDRAIISEAYFTTNGPLPEGLGISAPGWADICKRAEDIIFTVFLIILLTPAFLIIMIAIKFDSIGPILFVQERYGFRNNKIKVYKFRTMYAHCTDYTAHIQTGRGDKRVTRVGVFLRRHSLDELPQLINVLRGEMSLIGPRPHALGTTVQGKRLDLVVDGYIERHRVKPGITGWAQINGWRGQLNSREEAIQRVEHDLYYINNWSLLLDLKILLRTVSSIFNDTNAY
jgi:lipopolysaccharide/colanic/teichoic acid biosynthesis glycosyltransferase